MKNRIRKFVKTGTGIIVLFIILVLSASIIYTKAASNYFSIVETNITIMVGEIL